MRNLGKEYKPNASDEENMRERNAHIEEMHHAMERLEKKKKKQKKAFLCAAAGFLLGILYVTFISNGSEIMLKNGVSLYEAYISLAGGNGFWTLLLDFAPPYLLSIVTAILISKGNKGKLYFIITEMLMLTIVITIYLLYMSFTTII